MLFINSRFNVYFTLDHSPYGVLLFSVNGDLCFSEWGYSLLKNISSESRLLGLFTLNQCQATNLYHTFHVRRRVKEKKLGIRLRFSSVWEDHCMSLQLDKH